MSGRLVYCAAGCTRRDMHVDTCETREECEGCAPRQAEYGQLCAWCWQRLNGDIVDSPALVRYLWALAQSGAEATSGENVDGGVRPSERAILHGALDALDGLHAMLSSWAHLILEEHPQGSQMRGPDEAGTRRTLSTIRELDGETFIRRGEIAGVRDPDATSRLVRWLLPHLTWCAGQEWAGEMRREVGSVVRTTAARYPVEQRTRAIPGIPCPTCERMSLRFDPPTTERHSTQVNCSTRGCGRIFTEEEFRRLTKIVEWEHEQQAERSA